MSELRLAEQDKCIRIGTIAVSGPQAQLTIDNLAVAGIGAVLNYVPVAPRVSSEVFVRNIDPHTVSAVYNLLSSTEFVATA